MSIKYLLFTITLILSMHLKAQDEQWRQKININKEWKFLIGDHPGAEAVSYAESDWKKINLPHSFGTPYFGMGQWYTGYGWYRKEFDISENWKGKRLSIEFEGAFRDAEVFVNGLPVGHHQSGYTGFSYDITAAVKQGKNILAVRLNNNWNAQLAPRDGDHNFIGGIYRDVYLVVTNHAHITWYGTFITTPNLSIATGKANVQTEVANDGMATKTYLLKTSIFSPDKKLVDTFSSSSEIQSGSIFNFNQEGHAIKNPQLWHPQHPWMYEAVSELYENGKKTDVYRTAFGFRWMDWRADSGFYLNGSHYYFKGVNVHQDHAGWASAVPNSGFVRDIKMVKEAGFDFIRGSHYPHDPSFADACDSLGMLFWSENNLWAAGGFSEEGNWFTARSGSFPIHEEDIAPYKESVKTSLREMIRVNRNHPSIVTWSMSNEPFFTEKSTMPEVRVFLKELVDYTHQLDPSRKVAIGGAQRGDIDMLGDIAGYNGDGARLFIHPKTPNLVSEYGSTIDDRPGKYIPGFGDLQPEQLAWRSGQVLWCAFDYGTHFGEGKFGKMGMIDYFRLPKRMWYWYRNEYRHIPSPAWPDSGMAAALKLTSDKTTISNTDGTDDVQLIVTVTDKDGKPISNSPDVKLTLESGPGQFPTGNSISFGNRSDIAIRDGKAAIEFRSYYAGKSIIRATSPGLKDAIITIITKGSQQFIQGKTPKAEDVTYARVKAIIPITKNDVNQNVAFQKPTRAKVEIAGHSANMANDQDTNTYWSAGNSPTGNWWQADLENLVKVEKVKLTFPKKANYRYTVGVSEDGINWKIISEKRNTTNTDKVQTIIPLADASGRFLRISFSDNTEEAISEVEVYEKDKSTPLTLIIKK